jgi:hypothetical protein
LTYYDILGLCSKLNCKKYSAIIEGKEYKGVGATITLEASWEKCSCCGCEGNSIDAGISATSKVGFGWADEVTILGVKFGYSVLGPQLAGKSQLHFVKDCGETKYAVHENEVSELDFSIELSGGIYVAGATGTIGGSVFAEYGLEADDTGADAYVTFGYDATAEGGWSLGLVNITFSHHFKDGGTTFKTPRITW